MTEKSYFWDGYTSIVGHANESPYDHEEFQQLFGLLACFNPALSGVIPSWGNALQNITVVGSTQVRVKSGRAIVKNALYESDADVIHTVAVAPGTQYYYRIVLRKDNGAQTIRQVLLGPTSGGYPPLVQTDAVWDMPLSILISQIVGGVIYVTGGQEERSIHPDGTELFPMITRLGGSATDWNSPGTTQRSILLESSIQTGVVLWTGSAISGLVVVTFPYAFDYSPIVFLGNSDYGHMDDWTCGKIIVSADGVTTNGFNLLWKSIISSARTELHLPWMAIGPKAIR